MVSVIKEVPIGCYDLYEYVLTKYKKPSISIFDRIFDNYNPIIQHFDNYDFKKLTDLQLKENLTKLLEHSATLFKANGYKINTDKFYVEFHQYSVVGKKISPTLDWHEDDYGAVNYNVCSMIYYLEKEKNIIGGNIEFKDFGVVEVEPPMVVMFNGDLAHRPEPMEGNGYRDSIVVMFERVE